MVDNTICPNLKAPKIGTKLMKNKGTSMGFSVKKRDMHFFSLQKCQKITQKRGTKPENGTAVFLTSKIGTVGEYAILHYPELYNTSYYMLVSQFYLVILYIAS